MNAIEGDFHDLFCRKLYEIYPGKRCVDEPAGSCAACMDVIARSIGRHIDYSRGDSLKTTGVRFVKSSE